MVRHAKTRPGPDITRQLVDDRAGERLDPAADVTDQVVVVLGSQLVVPASVTERHPDNGALALEPANGSEHRRRVRRETLERQVILEVVERPAVPGAPTHDGEHLSGDSRAPWHTRETIRK